MPWRRVRGTALVLAALFAAGVLLAALLFRDRLLAGLIAAACAYVLGPLLVPVRYRIDADGLTRRSRFASRHFPWTRFARWEMGPAGRTAILRFAGVRGRLAGGVTLFLPEEPVTGEALRALAARLPGA